MEQFTLPLNFALFGPLRLFPENQVIPQHVFDKLILAHAVPGHHSIQHRLDFLINLYVQLPLRHDLPFQ
jgi:hypothetical protein